MFAFTSLCICACIWGMLLFHSAETRLWQVMLNCYANFMYHDLVHVWMRMQGSLDVRKTLGLRLSHGRMGSPQVCFADLAGRENEKLTQAGGWSRLSFVANWLLILCGSLPSGSLDFCFFGLVGVAISSTKGWEFLEDSPGCSNLHLRLVNNFGKVWIVGRELDP